jgi:hypothetical protein
MIFLNASNQFFKLEAKFSDIYIIAMQLFKFFARFALHTPLKLLKYYFLKLFFKCE